ncbi:MAG: hypothetical protein ABIH79_01090 [archaeon]
MGKIKIPKNQPKEETFEDIRNRYYKAPRGSEDEKNAFKDWINKSEKEHSSK